jgi:putative DNA primase/helicase
VLATIGPDYAAKTPPDLLMQARGERHPCELADLCGRRLVVASETHQGRRLNESLVKDITGGEPIKARRMRENFWEFRPSHKAILLTNHKPEVAGVDEGIWRRLRLVPFTVTFMNPDDLSDGAEVAPGVRLQDKNLGHKLEAEREGILAWMVRGCLDWQRDGLTMPEAVRAATRQYRESEDVAAQFVTENCITGREMRCKASALYGAYKRWAEALGLQVMSSKAFGDAMTMRGAVRYTSNGVWYRGLAPRPADSTEGSSFRSG